MTAQIELTDGTLAVVDDRDLDALLAFRWYHLLSSNGGRGSGYAYRAIGKAARRTAIMMHRQVMELHGVLVPDGYEVDHINGDSLDNRLINLRPATHAENVRNSRKKMHRHTLSVFKGVSRGKTGRWVAKIREAGRTRELGRFDTDVEAARAYDAAALRLYGAFALTNAMLALRQMAERRASADATERMIRLPNVTDRRRPRPAAAVAENTSLGRAPL